MDDGTAEMAGSKVSSSGGTTGTTERHTTTAKPGKYPVPHVSFDLDGDALQRRLSTRDGQEEEEEEEERDSCHKSAPGLPSERRWRKAQSGPRLFSSDAEDFWSRDASLQQTSVLGPGDGCGAKPEGNGNEMQGVAADCYGGRPGSSGSSLGSMSHLQGSVGSSAASVLPRTRTPSQRSKQRLSRQAACCPLEETTLEGQFDCGEMDEWGGTEEIPGVSMTEAAAATGPDSRLASLVSRVSWIAQDVGHLLWNSSMALEQVRREGLRPAGARWSCCVLSLLRESNVLSVVKDSRVFSVLQGSVVFSMFKNSLIYSLVKKLPLMPDIQGEMTQNLLGDQIRSQIPVSTPRLKSEESPVDVSQSPGVIRTRSNGTWAACSTRAQEMTYLQVKQEDRLNTESLPLRDISERTTTHSPEDGDPTLNNSRTLPNKEEIQMSSQTLIEFPESLLNLQTLPLLDLMDALQSVIPISVLISQKIVAVYWLNVAKSSQPVPCPGLLILVERGLYTLTSDSGLLVLFHHLPWLQLKEVQISLGGHSLRLMGSTKESILGVYTHNQKLTKELSRAILGIVHPWDNWFSQHPLLHGDLMKMSLDWETYIPDLLLDAGLRVCCQFQKSLADLVYLLHCNMDQETVSLGQLQLLLYTGVAVCLIPSTPTEYLTQLLLTDTHLGLVQEDAVFYPPPPSVPMEPVCPQFHDLTLCRRSDVRCMLVHDEDERGAVRLDVIIANVRGRGHPESETRAGTPSAHASNSSPHAEVWKLTFSCSSEADCLINHLSNG